MDTSTTPIIFYIAIGVAGLLLVTLFVVWLRAKFAQPELYGMSRDEIRKRWAALPAMTKQGIMGTKLAVLEADNLLDAALKSLMIPGDTLGERLKVAGYKYPKLQNVWWAHKLRNQIAHDASAQFSVRQGQQALDEFERALKHLSIL